MILNQLDDIFIILKSKAMIQTYFDPDYCIIHLDQLLAPGGYAWVFPKGKDKVNIGLGVQQKAFNSYNKTQKTSKKS